VTDNLRDEMEFHKFSLVGSNDSIFLVLINELPESFQMKLKNSCYEASTRLLALRVKDVLQISPNVLCRWDRHPSVWLSVDKN